MRQHNKPFLLLVLGLLIAVSVLKIIFYNYNHALLFADNGATGPGNKTAMAYWSLLYDLLIILLINIPLLLLLQLGRRLPAWVSAYATIPFFALLNSGMLLLNMADIFYFRFHFQRANADLLFVLDHPFKELFGQRLLSVIIVFALLILVCLFVIILLRWFYKKFRAGNYGYAWSIAAGIAVIVCLSSRKQVSKLAVPTYPLVELNSSELLVAENSLHSFLFSLGRRNAEIEIKKYMPAAEADSLLSLKKTVAAPEGISGKKNIVLFIMESVPYDYFDDASPNRIKMPFFDSIIQKSRSFDNACCYFLHSNKAITAILAATPTLTDVPLYHSPFVSLPVTPIGKVLKDQGYSSFFCIGDDYDNFGFAKCINWMGIDHYYCRQDMSAYSQFPTHPMGMHDQYVLDFMLGKISASTAPFFAVNYSISTHYPYDLPPGYAEPLPASYSRPMKSMRYYDHSLQEFFNKAKLQPWFANSIFIFCSDHWLVPREENPVFNKVGSFRIPLIIYDPSSNEKITSHDMVSQFDIQSTILSLSGYRGSTISYGGNLLDSASLKSGKIFTKVNSTLYQVIDTAYTLGYNIVTGKAEYLYHYTADRALQDNLLGDIPHAYIQSLLTKNIQAFLQKATAQYYHQPFQ